MAPRIEPITLSDPLTLASHIVRHYEESGRDGQHHFSPVWGLERSWVADALERRLRTPTSVPGWGRGFAVHDEGRIVGHAEIRGGVVTAALHRAEFSVGLELPYRRLGLGRTLTERAIGLARELGLAWVDLRVFAHNTPARRLYASLGFVEIGTFTDAFRMHDGAPVDDVAMVLRLRGGPSVSGS